MGNKLVVLVVIGLLAFVLTTVIGFVVTDNETDKTIRLTNEFVETVSYHGALTAAEYEAFKNQIPLKSIKINLTSIQDSALLSESNDILNAVFDAQIWGDANTPNTLLCSTGDLTERGIYKFKVGDKLKVDVFNLEPTVFDSIVDMASGKSQGNIKIIASRTEVIVNTKY